MEEFLSAYRAWFQAPLPEGSARDDLGELHGDLHVAFEWILSTAEPFAERGVLVPAGVDIDGGLNDLRLRLASLRPSLSGPDADRAEEYANYLGLLEAVRVAYLKATAKL